MDHYAELRTRTVEASLASGETLRPESAASRAVMSSRPGTAGSRSANSIIKEASAFAACSELQLPSIIGTDPKLLFHFVSSALGIDICAQDIKGVAAGSGLYVSCRTRHTYTKLLVAFKGKQFLAPSSAELNHILDEAMLLSILRRQPDSDIFSEKFPITAKAHRHLYQDAEKIIYVTLVKDHLESCFQDAQAGSSPATGQRFHYTVQFNALWTNLVQFQFFSLRHFIETMEQGIDVTHAFRKWLFLFAYQPRLQSTKVDSGNHALQKLCNEAIAEEEIAIAWERTADLSRGPAAYE